MEYQEEQLQLDLQPKYETGEQAKYAMSNDFIRMPKSLSAPALKVFILALTKIDWNKINPKDSNRRISVSFTLREMINACGSESNNIEYYRKALTELIAKSVFTINNNKFWARGNIFHEVWLDKETNEATVYISPVLNKYIEGLGNGRFTVYLQSNTYRMKSRFAITLYWNLFSWMDHSRDRKDPLSEITKTYTTRELKEMFDLPDDAYCRADGKFDRPAFEKKVIIRAVKEINDLSNIRVGWKKIKRGKMVLGYTFNAFRHDAHEVIDTELGINEGWNY